MSFKKININRSGVFGAIQSFNESYTIQIKEYNNFYKYHISLDNKIISKINVYENNNGKTSITWHECKNPELSKEIAEHIIEKCKFPDELNTTIYIKNVDKEKLDKLFEYLTDYCNAALKEKKNLTNGIQYKFKSLYGDTVVLNHFNNNAFNVQGTNGLMKSQTIEGLSAYLDYSDIVEATLNSYKVDDIDSNGIEGLFNARLPVACNEISDTTKTIILPVFVLERLKIDNDVIADFSFIVFPVFRGLEGCIKEFFSKYNINIGNNIGGQFNYIPNDDTHILNQNIQEQIGENIAVKVLNKMYNHHKNNRHAIFHVDDTILTTRMIDNKEMAYSIVNETLELIEKCYIAIAKNDESYLQ